MKIDFSIMIKYIPMLLNGAWMTIVLSLSSVGIGVILGLLAAIMKMSHIKLFHYIASAYIEVVRGTPLLIQIFLIYFALPEILGFNIPEFPAAVAAISLNSGAYVSEIIRAGIQGVDRGQTEAAYSLGMSSRLAMQYIIIPQAVKNILPALANEFITLIKESSVVSVIGMTELTREGDIISSITYSTFEPIITVAAIYFIMTFSLSKLMGVFEGRLKKSDYR